MYEDNLAQLHTSRGLLVVTQFSFYTGDYFFYESGYKLNTESLTSWTQMQSNKRHKYIEIPEEIINICHFLFLERFFEFELSC